MISANRNLVIALGLMVSKNPRHFIQFHWYYHVSDSDRYTDCGWQDTTNRPDTNCVYVEDGILADAAK